MVWLATVEHIYSAIASQRAGFKTLEKHNAARFGQSSAYKKVEKKDDLLYLSDQNFFQICEDARVFNKNARKLLTGKLDTRNRCGHPTGYVIGREEAVVFIESLRSRDDRAGIEEDHGTRGRSRRGTSGPSRDR